VDDEIARKNISIHIHLHCTTVIIFLLFFSSNFEKLQQLNQFLKINFAISFSILRKNIL